jgi:hypothetical protein
MEAKVEIEEEKKRLREAGAERVATPTSTTGPESTGEPTSTVEPKSDEEGT